MSNMSNCSWGKWPKSTALILKKRVAKYLQLLQKLLQLQTTLEVKDMSHPA